jgi:hypothetical protein
MPRVPIVHRTKEQLHELECLYQTMALAATDPRLSTWVFIVRADDRHVAWSRVLPRLRTYAATLKDKAA